MLLIVSLKMSHSMLGLILRMEALALISMEVRLDSHSHIFYE